MKIIIAPDSFKDSLSAKEVANNIEIGVLKELPNAQIVKLPVSDGGEGLLDALIEPTGGTVLKAIVKDPLLRDIEAKYGVLGDGTTGVVEMATASGLELLTEEDRNPMVTSTYGVGQLLKELLDKKCNKIIIGLGGSATNDGGAGMVRALGGLFLDEKGNEIPQGGENLINLNRIDLSNFDKRIFDCGIIGACDVSNPLTGEFGASFVFGGQKGGSENDLKLLDAALENYAQVIQKTLSKDVSTVKGAGAAGGLGAGLLGFLDAKLISGIELILDSLNLKMHLQNSDLVLTGEGKIDEQTLYGKTIAGIAKLSKQQGVPVIAIAGSCGDYLEPMYKIGVTAVFSIMNKPMTLNKAIENTAELIQSCTRNIIAVMNIKN